MGVEKQVLRPGTGPKPTPGQTVTDHCAGYGKNGDLSEKFLSTKDKGQQPFSFQIGKGSVIKDGMKVSWECKWEKLLVFGALQIMLMVLMDFQHGEYGLSS